MKEDTIKFYDFEKKAQDRIMEFIYNKIDQPKEIERIDKLLENLKFLVPDECKDIIMELEEAIISNKADSIRKVTFYLLKNGEAIKRGIIGI